MLPRSGALLALLMSSQAAGAQAAAAPEVVEIRTRAPSSVELPAVGASLVVNFSVSRRTPGEAGRANAARATGGRVGRLLVLSTDPPADRNANPWGLMRDVVVTGARAGSPTPVQAPSVTVAVTVYTRWEFVPGSP